MSTAAEPDLQEIRSRALRAIAPLKPADLDGSSQRTLFMGGKRTDAGRSLPPYYLVYFLLVDLLGFRNLGRWEKTAWTVPVDVDGTTLLIEHRKFGLGVFAADLPADEAAAANAVKCVHRAVKAARPYSTGVPPRPSGSRGSTW